MNFLLREITHAQITVTTISRRWSVELEMKNHYGFRSQTGMFDDEGPNFFQRDVQKSICVVLKSTEILFGRILRTTLDMHLINPIIEDAALADDVSAADREDPRVHELI